jgi:hypothetical protein
MTDAEVVRPTRCSFAVWPGDDPLIRQLDEAKCWFGNEAEATKVVINWEPSSLGLVVEGSGGTKKNDMMSKAKDKKVESVQLDLSTICGWLRNYMWKRFDTTHEDNETGWHRCRKVVPAKPFVTAQSTYHLLKPKPELRYTPLVCSLTSF